MDRERIIFTSHHILQIIFKHLNARSLNSCAQVCTLWNRIVKQLFEKNRRVIIHNFFKVGICYNGEIRRRLGICPIFKHCVMEAELFQELKNIRIEPVFFIRYVVLYLLNSTNFFSPLFS
ncbi:f-box domain-containing protein [Trichonephila inaurata madagascariensis]|uniref:F-box domain-containing protein n=1 Tax=Trichonephila inaurata madagascariensis TaxID=2747483 RepID=A0A8X6WPX3_9ARAC|nr:f-box domain-containing protein [Trichonephila inaurata madagascariensis]